jgi:hypothetical protein
MALIFTDKKRQNIRDPFVVSFCFLKEPAFGFSRNSALFVVKTFLFERILILAFG